MHLPVYLQKNKRERTENMGKFAGGGQCEKFYVKNSFFRIFVVKNKAVLVLFLILFSGSHGRNAFFKQG